MAYTAELRKLVVERLNRVPGVTYYRHDPPSAVYPFKVCDLRNIDLGSLSRDDYVLDIDVYDRGLSSIQADDIADQIEQIFTADGGHLNNPTEHLLPTFYKIYRTSIIEDEKEIQHINLRFQAQVYTRE